MNRLCIASFLVLSVSTGFAQTNVAASANGGVATQSTLFTGGDAWKAIDGNRSGNWGDGSVQHTQSNLNAWWEVEFSALNLIDEVRVFNRTDCCANRIDSFSVILYDASNTNVWQSTGNTFTADIISGSNVRGMTFDTPAVLAKKLRIQLDGTNYLHMAEVEAINAVPEPATLAVLGMSAVFAAKRRRK